MILMPIEKRTEMASRRAHDAIKQLREICDSVQVVATIYDNETDQTYLVKVGQGDWFARAGALKEVIEK